VPSIALQPFTSIIKYDDYKVIGNESGSTFGFEEAIHFLGDIFLLGVDKDIT
jgi:hypothetical protein